VRAGFVAVLVVLATGLAYSQKSSSSDDSFVTDPVLRAYLERSSYQHGSLHGYEDGYQFGDLDFHLQRPEPEFKKVKEYRSATRGYIEGDKGEYRAGYQHGYLLGYRDAVAGRPFAALERLQAAVEERPVTVAEEPAGEGSEQIEVATFAPPSKPLKVPMDAIFLVQEISVEQPSAEARAAKDSALGRIMTNLRRTFMPAMITPQALVQASPR
jgi:hypothetical protein